MNIAQIRNYDVANGPGLRVSLFTSGCMHNCFNCFNKEYQNYNYGESFKNKHIEDIQRYLKSERISGLSLLGGEPMDAPIELVKLINSLTFRKEQDIWLWSGYLFEDIIKDKNKKKLLEKLDVLIDGKFIEAKKDLTLKFRGSSNQRVIDVQKSLDKNKVIILEGD